MATRQRPASLTRDPKVPLTQRFVYAPDASNLANFLRISPWQADEVRAALRRFQVQCPLAAAEQSGAERVTYLNIDDPLGEKDRATEYLAPVDWHHDHSESTKSKAIACTDLACLHFLCQTPLTETALNGIDQPMRRPFLRLLTWGRPPHFAALTLLGCALLLYLLTLDNGLQPEELVGGDLITHQYAQVQARPSNAPGYPLYTMGGWLWFHTVRGVIELAGNPLPNPIPILSSYSTFWALLALWLLYRILCHVTRTKAWPDGDWPLAWLLTAFFAVTYFFWYYATTTEQYSSAVAQTLAIVYVYLLWRDSAGSRGWGVGHRGASSAPLSTPYSLLPIFLLAFLCGLSLAHMLTVAFIVPPLVLVVLWEAPWLVRSWKIVAGGMVAAFLPLVSYLYVYLRGAAHPEWWGTGEWANTQAWFWDFVSTAQGRAELGWGFEPGRAFFGNQFPELVWHELSLPILILGLVGIALLGRKMATLLYGTLALYLLFCWGYRYGNWYQVILPAYPLILVGAAVLVQRLIQLPSEFSQRWKLAGLGARWLLLLGLVGLIGWRFLLSLPGADSRNRAEDTALKRAAQLIAQPLPVGAHLFAEVQDALALDYLIHIWQVRPDLRVVSSPAAGETLRRGEPVFSTWQAATTLRLELPGDLHPGVESAGPDWVRFGLATEEAVTSPAVIRDQPVTPAVSLVGYTLVATPTPIPVQGDLPPTLDVTLYWRITGDWPEELAISLRPTAGGAFVPDPGAEHALLQQDRPRPVHGLLESNDNRSERIVADAYRLPLVKGIDAVTVLLYRHNEGGFEDVARIDIPVP